MKSTQAADVRAFGQADIPRLEDLQPEGWTDIVPAFGFYLRSGFCRPLKIVVGGELAAVSTAIVFPGTGWLAHVIVREDFRGRGMGRRIAEAALAVLDSAGCRTVSLIATESGRPVYLKAGFRDQVEYSVYEGSCIPISCSADGVRPLTAADVPGLERLDRTISGERRCQLLGTALAGAFVRVDSGRITGAYLPALGEGLVIASDADSGAALLREKIVHDVKITSPAENWAARDVLEGGGYRETRRIMRMVRGPEFIWKPAGLFGRVGGNFG